MTKDELVFGVCYEDGDITSTSYNIVFGDKKFGRIQKILNVH